MAQTTHFTALPWTRSGGAFRWLRRFGIRLGRDEAPPTVVLCYGLYQGESVEEWCGRNPELAPDPDDDTVVWVLPEQPLPRPVH